MKVVVTGSSGHVGGAIARHLHDQGHTVIGVSRRRSDILPEAIAQLGLDIGAPDVIQCATEGIVACDAVVHAAACLDESSDCTETSRVNCLGTHQTLMLAQATKAARFVYISSLSVLGAPQEHPVTETHPVAPGTAYAASKLYGELLTTQADSTRMRAVSFRISSPVGPGLAYKRIFRVFVENAVHNKPIVLHGSGTRKQDYIDVRDIAAATAAVLSSSASGIFNIGAGVPVSNLELAQCCVRLSLIHISEPTRPY